MQPNRSVSCNKKKKIQKLAFVFYGDWIQSIVCLPQRVNMGGRLAPFKQTSQMATVSTLLQLKDYRDQKLEFWVIVYVATKQHCCISLSLQAQRSNWAATKSTGCMLGKTSIWLRLCLLYIWIYFYVCVLIKPTKSRHTILPPSSKYKKE